MFSIKPDEVKKRISELDGYESELRGIASEIGSIAGSSVIRTSAYRMVQNSLRFQSQYVRENAAGMGNVRAGLLSAAQEYMTAEGDICARAGATKYEGERKFSSGMEIKNSENDVLEFLNHSMNNVNNEKEILSMIKTLLGGYDSWGKNGEAGILKDAISYIEDFSEFFFGDKKGLTGISNWCNLADSSADVWIKTYDYFASTYKGVTTGFFGEIAKRNVKIMGLSTGILGLAGSILSASDGIDEKKWQSVVADYIGCGKDVLSIVKSGYQLKHIKDVESLANLKAGPWSALGVYSAIGDAGIRVIEQGFRSHEKYYADNKWDLGDTGATCIDISLAGLYGISHTLTLGFDDFIFGAIDKATGGNGNQDMSYIEKSAEGWKILANNIGKGIGEWWKKTFK